MRISLEWLSEFVDTGMHPNEAAHRLTMAGHEVESIEGAGDDFVFEVNVTPNRPDCLSVLGIAREVSALTGLALRLPAHHIEEGPVSGFFVEIKNKEKDLCRRYAGRVIKGVRIEGSPEWIKRRLEKGNIRPVNNVVDVTNYVLLEMGHPLHAFDLSTLKGGKIVVDTAQKGTSIVTLDGVKRNLPHDSLLIWDGERPVAVAGVMGGKETEVTAHTTDIFLESAWFDPASVRRTSRALGISSESSYRFERGADIEGLETALDRASYLIKEVAGGEIFQKIDIYPEGFAPVHLDISSDRVNRILGTAISISEMEAILKRLNFNIARKKEHLIVTPPSYRLDVRRDSDVIEEVARLYGYQRIPVEMPSAPIASGGADRRHRVISSIKESIRMAGFNEAINYSFMNPIYLDILGIPPSDARRRSIAVKNPLREEDSLLRTTLIPSLLENLIRNLSYGIRQIRLFEVSRVFLEDKKGVLPDEPLRLAGISLSEKSPALWKEEVEDFYLVKGALEALFNELRLAEYAFLPSDEPFLLQKGKSADILLSSGRKSGFIGALSPQVAERLGIKTKADIIVFELDAGGIVSLTPAALSYKSIPKFPYVERDIAIVVSDSVRASDIISLIKAYPSGLIEEVSVFDSFKGGSIPSGMKSLGFSIRYRSKDRTLKDEEVEAVHSGIVKEVTEKTKGELRK